MRTLPLILLAAAACHDAPTHPEPPLCLRVAAVLTDAHGVTIGDTTWLSVSPVEGVACRSVP